MPQLTARHTHTHITGSVHKDQNAANETRETGKQIQAQIMPETHQKRRVNKRELVCVPHHGDFADEIRNEALIGSRLNQQLLERDRGALPCAAEHTTKRARPNAVPNLEVVEGNLLDRRVIKERWGTLREYTVQQQCQERGSEKDEEGLKL